MGWLKVSIAMLADGAGLCEEAATATRTEWGALASLVDPLFILPGEEGGRNYRRAASGPVSRTDTRSEMSVALSDHSKTGGYEIGRVRRCPHGGEARRPR